MNTKSTLRCMGTTQPPNTEIVNKVKRSSRNVCSLAIFALVAVLVIVMACIFALFVNIAELRAATDSLQQQQNKKLNNSTEMTDGLIQMVNVQLRQDIESMWQNTTNTALELNGLIQNNGQYAVKSIHKQD